jgi:hypothetical protein
LIPLDPSNNPEQQRTSLAGLACGGIQPGKNDFKTSAMIPPKTNPTIHFNSNKSLLSGASSICKSFFVTKSVSLCASRKASTIALACSSGMPDAFSFSTNLRVSM